MFYKLVESIDGSFNFDLINKSQYPKTDFSAIYFQTSKEHAMNYGTHRAHLAKHDYIILIKLILKATNTNNEKYYELDNPIYGRHDISAEQKATLIRKELHDAYKINIPADELLIDSLDKPLKLIEYDNVYELIIPHHMFNDKYVTVEVLDKFKVKSKLIGDVVYKYI